MIENKVYHKVLTIAGSDTCGGAGIQADIKTFSALGCYGMSVITALTAQNTKAVSGIHAVPPSFVELQIEAIFRDMGSDSVKIGMLYSKELIKAVAKQLKKYSAGNIVLDPVMIAQSGNKLMEHDALETLKKHLMPIATVITPNLPEAQALLGREIKGAEDIKKAAKELASYGSKSILLKGGHLKDIDSTDVLYIRKDDRFVTLKHPRIKTSNNHGTGCTLSSAIAAYLAKGFLIEDAVRKAKQYISRAIQSGQSYKLGRGRGPVHHFFDFWE